MSQQAAAPAGEIKSLTGLRGVAALYVVGYHLTRGLPEGHVQRFFGHGYLAVDLFFILSGFVMTLVYSKRGAGMPSVRDYTHFILKRLGRIYPLYLFANLTMILIVLFVLKMAFGWHLILANLLLINEWGLAPSIDFPAWSISAEFMAYLLFPFISPLVAAGNRHVAWVLALCCILCLFKLTSIMVIVPPAYGTNDVHQLGSLNFSWFGPYPILRCLTEFTLGMIACRFMRELGERVARLPRYADLVIVLGIVLLMQLADSDVAIVLLFVLLIGTLVRVPLSPLSRFLSAAPLHWLGLISYSLYMMHVPVFLLVDTTLHIRQSVKMHALIVIPILLVSALCYYAIEKPGREWSRRLIGQRKSPPIDAEPSAP